MRRSVTAILGVVIGGALAVDLVIAWGTWGDAFREWRLAGRRGFASRTFVDEAGGRHTYILFVPHDPPQPPLARGGSMGRPLILFLNGWGENGVDGFRQLSNNFGLPIWETKRGFPFVVLAPQCRPGGSWQPDSPDTKRVLALLEEVIEKHNIDRDRIFVTGPSAGGTGAWQFGAALGTVLFPLFARHAADGAIDRLRDDLTLGLRLVVALGVPASAGLMLIAQPLTRALLEHGQFTAADGDRTAALIVAYASGVWAFCALPILARGFYAVGDRLAPVRVGACALFFDTLLNLTLIWPLAERGLAYSTALSAVAQASALAWLLQRRLGPFDWPALARTTARTLAATAVMSAACLAALRVLPAPSTLPAEFAALFVPLAVGVAVFLVMARLLGLDEPWLLVRAADTSPHTGGESDAEVA